MALEWRSVAQNENILARFAIFQIEKEKENTCAKKRKPPPLRVLENVPSETKIRRQRRAKRPGLNLNEEARETGNDS